jgi:hypothetical protein
VPPWPESRSRHPQDLLDLGEYERRGTALPQSFGDDGLPDNQYALLERNVMFEETGAFDIDIPVAVVTGELTVNGEPPGGDVAATFFLRTAAGDTVIAATLDEPTYRAELVPGTYDVFYSGQIWGNAIVLSNGEVRSRITASTSSCSTKPGGATRGVVHDLQARRRFELPPDASQLIFL